MPNALEKKYLNAKFETKWQFLFSMNNISKDPRNVVSKINEAKIISPLDM